MPCRRSPGRRRCRGDIIAELDRTSGYIEWQCPLCGDHGMIHGWEDKPTERIWYYDLSDVKVGKKTPLTLKHFEDFAAKLDTREDSERSWTVDLSARRAKAAADAQPFKDTARGKSQDAERIKDRLGELKKARPRDEAAIAEADTRVAGLLKEAREATNKAEGIESAVYDLKAVNPNRKAEVDHRTPAELLDLVEAKGREVAEALARLRAMTTTA